MPTCICTLPTLPSCCYTCIMLNAKASITGKHMHVQGHFWRWLCNRNLNTSDKHRRRKQGIRGASSCLGCCIACPQAALPRAWLVKDKHGIYCWRDDRDSWGKEVAFAPFAP